ncbi:MarR family transcriptional regulator [Staphylococcus ursi]|uniref:MarR family winged helix-turn-helix transcriptional regulator n=1 Tax=Staphylococcus sp. MI 10-1553 TaxID=1912064 RepID=UPI001398B54F|nr:MarR family transcriptional regulator [Staphylococcus sp. MI 10-1553]QHW37597.1 MarR family transcriptional regulator [Staphylococcus sp. MI 10-1553]
MNDFFSLTLSLYRPYVKKIEPILNEHSLNLARWLVLKDIGYHQPTALVEIAKRRFIEKSTTHQILKVFEEKQLIVVTTDKNDKRHKWIELSKEGQVLFQSINKRILEMDDKILSEVKNDENFEHICQFMEQLLNRMKGS